MNGRSVAKLLTLIAVVAVCEIYWLRPTTPGVIVASPARLQVNMKYGERQEVDVRLENVGRLPAVILGVSSSCGCTIGTLDAKQIGAGRSTVLKAVIHASSIGRKVATVDLEYESSMKRKFVRIPVVMNVSETSGTRVLSYPKDVLAQCDVTHGGQTEFEIRTLEKAGVPPDLIEVRSADERCELRLLGMEPSAPDRNGKVERTYQIELIVRPSVPFAAIATMRFREPLAAPAGNIAVLVRPKARTRVIPATVDLPAIPGDSSRQHHEILLISEVDVEDWKLADDLSVPKWFSVEFKRLRSNITRVIIADSRSSETKSDRITDFELKLNSSTEAVSIPLRLREEGQKGRAKGSDM